MLFHYRDRGPAGGSDFVFRELGPVENRRLSKLKSAAVGHAA